MTTSSPTGRARLRGRAGTALRILITADGSSGLRQYSLELARGLSRLGHETILALLGGAAKAEQGAAAALVPGLRVVDTGLAVDGLADEGALRGTAEALVVLAEAVEADVVQLHAPGLAALADFGIPVVAVHHGCIATQWEAVAGDALPRDFAWRTRSLLAGFHAADLIVASTDALASALQRLYGLDAKPRVVHHGCSPPVAPSGIPRDFAFTAGRLWDKGQNLALLDAAAGRAGVPVRAAGPLSGPDGAPVLFDNLSCLGPLGREERARWLSGRPVFVSAALYEPSGLAIVEAAAAGCPLILSDIPAHRELWDEVARFVSPRDEAGFTRAIADLVGDDFERAVMGRAARERAGRYTADAMAAQMAALYRGLLPAVHGPVLASARAAA